jgi:hypothetical protein
MRNREEIEQDSKRVDSLILEVLLDIRNQLKEKRNGTSNIRKSSKRVKGGTSKL